MKKLYSLLSLMVLSLAGVFTASAAQVTVIVDNPAAIKIGKNVYDYSTWTQQYVSLVDEVTEMNIFEIEGTVQFDIAEPTTMSSHR